MKIIHLLLLFILFTSNVFANDTSTSALVGQLFSNLPTIYTASADIIAKIKTEQEYNYTHAAEIKQKLDAVDRLATASQKEIILYSWQDKKIGDRLLSTTYTSKPLFLSLMNSGWPKVRDEARAGRGLYVSEKIYDSDEYIPEEGTGEGMIIETILPKGTKILDVTDPQVQTALKKSGVIAVSLNELYELDPPIAIKYSAFQGRNYWVLKNPPGVMIQEFSGRGFTTQQLLENGQRVQSSERSQAIIRERLKHILSAQIIEPTNESADCVSPAATSNTALLSSAASYLASFYATPAAPKTIHLFRADGSCGAFTASRPHTEIERTVATSFCKDEQGVEYHWVIDPEQNRIRCHATPTGHPATHVSYENDSHCLALTEKKEDAKQNLMHALKLIPE